MKKIPTLFVRDPDDMRKVTREVHPDCQWVLDGEGEATRKYDGTCVMFDGRQWWARREVKKDRQPPEGFRLEEHDEVTGKSVGWEPAEQSSFAKCIGEAANGVKADHTHQQWACAVPGATYELLGPKVNGNPENVPDHLLVRHGYMSAVDIRERAGEPRDFDALMSWLLAHNWEGIVWHHPDGRMAKLKKRDAKFSVSEVTP